MIRDILVNLSTVKKADRARDYAISLAGQFDAHLTGISFFYEPAIPFASGLDAIPTQYIDERREENEKAAKSAKAAFLKTAEGLRTACHSPNATLFGAAALFAQIERHFDIGVVEQAGAETSAEYDFIIEAALFESGRPTIIVPYIWNRPASLDRILVCWDGGAPAARAVAEAIPLLHKAKQIEVLTIAENSKVTEDFPGAEIGEHLARHGLRINVKRIDIAETDIASAILSHASDISADLMVMGAYGHSRFREFILGGVTAEMLSAMTVPVLMSHL